MKIGEQLREMQPDIYRKLNNKKTRRENHLSFSYVDKLMRERRDIDERKCRGRG